MSISLDLDSGLELEETAVIDRAGSFPAPPALLHVLVGISNALDRFWSHGKYCRLHFSYQRG
jgi:hypothetical protein